MFVLKTIVLVIMVLKLLELLVLHIILTSVFPALVITTKQVVPVVHVLLVELGKDKRLLVLRELIVNVLKMIVLVIMVLELLELLVLHMRTISVHLVLVIFTKLILLVVHVLLAELEKDKQRLVLHQLIVYVHKTPVLVPMVLKQLELLVLQTVPTFVRPVVVVIILVVHHVLSILVLVKTV